MTDVSPESVSRNVLDERMPDAHQGPHMTGEELRQGSILGVLPRAMALDAGCRFRDARMSWRGSRVGGARPFRHSPGSHAGGSAA